MQVTSLSLVANMIGEETGMCVWLKANVSHLQLPPTLMDSNGIFIVIESSGFVYGVMCFADAITSGAAIMFIQHYMPEINEASLQEIEYFRWILIGGCGFSAILALMNIMVLWRMKTNDARKDA